MRARSSRSTTRRPADELRAATSRLDGRSIRLLAGPRVDPADAWRGAALVTTSPSINPDYPTTEPRLRAALAALRAARAAGDPTAPAIVSEADLVAAACARADGRRDRDEGQDDDGRADPRAARRRPGHRAILGGNIGRPIVERLPDLRPGDRVVIELSELQLPTLSRGTTVAVFTNVTSDHLDRHGTLEAYRAVKQRFAETVDPAGALVVNLDDPVVAGYVGLARGPGRHLPARPAGAGRGRRRRRLDRRGRRRAPRRSRRWARRDRTRRTGPAGRGAGAAGPPQPVERPGVRRRRAPVRGRARR